MRLLFATLTFLIAGAACASPVLSTQATPASASSPGSGAESTPGPGPGEASGVLILTTDIETGFYPVYGAETSDIFASIDVNGPEVQDELEGHFTAGLAEYEASLDYLTSVSGGRCRIDSGTVGVDVVVTLPRHEQFGLLTPRLQLRWEDYERRVAVHEQRHVDIFSEVITATRAEIESLSGRFSDCDRLDSEVTELWDSAFERDAALQADFHRGEARLSRDLRAPLEAAIAENDSRLAQLNAQLEGWSRELVDLGAEVEALDSGLAPYVTRMDTIRSEYPDLTLPEGVFEEYERLYSESTILNDERNALVSQHGDLVDAFNTSSGEFNSINSTNNELIEELNWLP